MCPSHKLYRKGEEIATGLGVPKSGMFPLGIRTFYDRGHIRMGITCALCHSTVDAASGKVTTIVVPTSIAIK